MPDLASTEPAPNTERRAPERRAPSADIITSMSVADHRRTSPTEISCFVLTISDTRTEANDTSGDAIAGALRGAGHLLAGRRIVRDEPATVRDLVLEQAGAVDVVITTGEI